MSLEQSDAGTGTNAAIADAAAGEAETPPPISFLRWAGPVMAAWVLVCVLYFLAAQRPEEISHAALHAPFFLFLVYAFLYVGWVSIHLSDRSFGAKFATSFLLVLVCVAALYVFPILLSWIAVLGNGLLVLGLAGIIGPFVIPLAVVITGAICGAALSWCEESASGRTQSGSHVPGIIAFGFLALGFLLVMANLDQPLLPAMVIAIAFPIPHLILSWRKRYRFPEPKTSRLSSVRVLMVTAIVFVGLYFVGVQRYVLEFGFSAFQWPRAVLEANAQYAFDKVLGEVFESPGGRGSLPIGGRSFLVPAALTEDVRLLRSPTAGEYRSLSMHIPYASWIERSDLQEIEPLGRSGWSERARVSVSAVSRFQVENDAEVLCAADRYFGLRQCFLSEVSRPWLTRLGVGPNALATDRLILPYERPFYESPFNSRPIFLLYAWDGLSGDGPGDDGIVVQCDLLARPDVDEGVQDLPSPQAIAYSCKIAFQDGSLWVTANIDPALLPYWRQIEAGMRRDVAAWETAAEGAESINAVARRQAELLSENRARWPLWRDFHCVLVATVGSDWAMPPGSPLRALGECPPVAPHQTGAEAG